MESLCSCSLHHFLLIAFVGEINIWSVFLLGWVANEFWCLIIYSAKRHRWLIGFYSAQIKFAALRTFQSYNSTYKKAAPWVIKSLSCILAPAKYLQIQRNLLCVGAPACWFIWNNFRVCIVKKKTSLRLARICWCAICQLHTHRKWVSIITTLLYALCCMGMKICADTYSMAQNHHDLILWILKLVYHFDISINSEI